MCTGAGLRRAAPVACGVTLQVRRPVRKYALSSADLHPLSAGGAKPRTRGVDAGSSLSQMSACEGADVLASAVLDVNGALLAHGPAVHKLNELYATWFALPETQQLARGLLQRLQCTAPAGAAGGDIARSPERPPPPWALAAAASASSPPMSPRRRPPSKGRAHCSGSPPPSPVLASLPRLSSPSVASDAGPSPLELTPPVARSALRRSPASPLDLSPNGAASPTASPSPGPSPGPSPDLSPGPSPPAASLLAMSVDEPEPTGGVLIRVGPRSPNALSPPLGPASPDAVSPPAAAPRSPPRAAVSPATVCA